jgi:hypothetical protein
MKVSKKQLDELIRLITIGVLKEWSSLSGDDKSTDPGTADDGVKPDDAMTAAEKSKQKRQNQMQVKHDLDQAKMQKKTDQERAESYKSQYDQWRRYDKTNDEKAVQDLQKKVAGSGTTSSTPSTPSY